MPKVLGEFLGDYVSRSDTLDGMNTIRTKAVVRTHDTNTSAIPVCHSHMRGSPTGDL